MKLIQENPYRIAGLLSNTTEKELLRQKSKIKRFNEVGKAITSEFDFSFLTSIIRNEEKIEKAFSDIEQNQNRVNHSLFWFVNTNPIDNTAIQYLISGDKEKAIEIWEKLIEDKEISARNFSAFNNISTLYLLNDSKDKLKQGITSKIELLESDYFKDFAQTVADETFTIDNNKQIQIFIDGILSELNGKYSTSQLIDLFSNCNGIAKKYISNKFTEEPIHNVEKQVEKAKENRIRNNLNAYKYGNDLFKNTKEDLSLLKSLLGSANLQYKLLTDNVAKEILQCSIDYFNESQEQDSTNEYLEEAMKLAKLAQNVAINPITKDRIKENIKTLEGMKDRVVNEAVALLQSVKDAYETNKTEIERQIERLKSTDFELRLGLKTINYSAVEENIRNSIDWSKVNQLLRLLLTDNNLRKIKESKNTDAKKEFVELARWLEEYSQQSSTISTLINKYKSIPPVLCFEISSVEVTNTDNKPFYVENIRYIGLKLNIISKGSQKVTFFKKYINPEDKYDYSSKSSPEGYTTSNVIEITPNTKIIDLGGWGNSKECTYMVGKHKIEVYVDHYKIYTATFDVDWSPNKKSELIKQLDLLQNELSDVKKFKWFRSTETKRKEVGEVEGRINKTKNILLNK